MPPWTPRTPASKLPRNMSEWRKLAQSKGLEHSSIRHARQLNSASKLRIEDYIRMRVIWPRRKQARNFPRLINSNKVKEILSGYKEFAAYLKGIGRTRTHEQLMEMGMFQLVRDSQLEVQNLDSTAPESSAVTFTHSQTVTQIPQSAHSDSSGPVDMILSITTSNLPDHDTELEDSPIEHTNDEQIVNEAMLEFLKAITMTIKGCLCKWTPGRAPFESMNFGKDTMTARTDGFLRAFDRKLIPDVFAIVEVKCQSRSRNKPSVFWQESAEMMAWMVHATMEGNRKCRSPTRRLLFSQDREKVYLTVGSCDPGYLDYLQSDGATDARVTGFLKMQEYGPWVTKNRVHMRHLSEVVTDHMLQTSAMIKEAMEEESNS